MTMARRAFRAAAVTLLLLAIPAHGRAQTAANADIATRAAPQWQRSLTKALTYQGVVVSTDQLLYWAIITGTAVSELEFLAANAVTGVAYYFTFDEAWRAAGFAPAYGESDVSVTKAISYRVFDTARVLGVTLAIGTPFSGSLAVTAAIAATRTGIYMLHDYVWSLATSRP
jgi:uncharacterized membrane protein